MSLHFEKVEGLGNHFVLVDERRLGTRNWSALAPRLCARGEGIGADGLLVLAETTRHDSAVRMRMFNPDGSEDMCGNGLRCVAHVEAASRALDDRPFLVETLAGPRETRVWLQDDLHATVRTSLGFPILEPSRMPALFDRGPVLGEPLRVQGRELLIHLVSLGTPHCVIFGDPPPESQFWSVSPAIERHEIFPEGVSVMWTTRKAPHSLVVRPWERAAGATLACGTGAAAAAVAGVMTGRVATPVTVSMPGGGLTIEWLGQGSEVYQVGPSRRVFRGTGFVYDD